jgi:hypothetical protein
MIEKYGLRCQTFHHVRNFVVRHVQNQRVELGKRTGFTEPAVFLHHAVVLGVIFKKRQFVYQGNASDGFKDALKNFLGVFRQQEFFCVFRNLGEDVAFVYQFFSASMRICDSMAMAIKSAIDREKLMSSLSHSSGGL